jgi:uncharacterized heparinase superfamily protein
VFGSGRQAGRWSAALDRLQARAPLLARPATGFAAPPEPRSIGCAARGVQLLAGQFLFAGRLIEAPGAALFDILPPDRAYSDALHGFGWLDDLAAVGDADAQQRAQDWTRDWIARFGTGRGPGWTPAVTGRRVLRWIHHGDQLLDGQSDPDRREFFRVLTRQSRFLSRRSRAAPAGLPRIEALAGLISSRLALAGLARRVGPAMAALDRECALSIDAEGGRPDRNPEALLEVFSLLVWSAEALRGANRLPMPGHQAAIGRIAPMLRALRHADGGLARFHGGGRGIEGRLDEALGASGVRTGSGAAPAAALAMGYARLWGGRTTVIADAAEPPSGASAHASTLAFELTSGRRPVIVSCGSGAAFGPEWRRAGRATASHSTLAIEGFSSSRLGRGGAVRRHLPDQLADRARVTQARLTRGAEGMSLAMAHDGWAATHGLTHARELHLSADGRALRGEDILGALGPGDRKRLDRVLKAARGAGLRFALRFHLHPDVIPALDPAASEVALSLKSGETWVFRHDGAAELTVEPSVYLDSARLAPRATLQIVLAAALTSFACQIDWTLAKSQDTPLAIRDLDREALPAGG